ncbi:MAG TPA: bacteriohemerythrin [Candidatus Rifleibacterium sp.]|nr:bacteriohemerythrin [Candidatus Rifleibacterium sp.]HPT45662.1 bacteriohemerythrin [Candidatus Rifleibacterium sp.]
MNHPGGNSLKWHESLSVGCELIDNQHQELIKLVNELEGSLSAGLSPELLAKSLRFIVNYTRFHFSAEEELMASLGFAELKQHKEIHNELIQKVTDILVQMKEGKKPDFVELVAYFTFWVKKHVMEEDQKIGVFWRQKNTGTTKIEAKTKSIAERRAEILPRLDKLKELFRMKLIEIEDFKTKKINLFESIFLELGVNKIAEGLSDLDHFLRHDVISSKEMNSIVASYLYKLNLEKDLDEIPDIEDKLIYVRLFREHEIISEERFVELKTKILDAI